MGKDAEKAQELPVNLARRGRRNTILLLLLPLLNLNPLNGGAKASPRTLSPGLRELGDLPLLG